MPGIQVQITRFVDTHQPGFVECQFVDARGRPWSFLEKIPVVTTAALWIDNEYPQPGTIDCEVLGRSADALGEIVIVDTERPCGVASIEGMSRFEIRPDILVD